MHNFVYVQNVTLKLFFYNQREMDAMSRNKALAVYLLGTFSQLLLVCLVVFFCNHYGVHSVLVNVFGVMIGGISTALWGSIAAICYKDFFNIQTSYKHYLLAFFLIILDFSFLFLGGKIVQFIWYLPFLMFFKFIVFGGLEEIGWRYVFQPLLQEKFHYFQATILTFIIWSIWHLLFFYIDGSLAILQIVPFLFGLLTNSFILSSLYLKTKNLWICVMTHSMINVFSQLTMSDDHYGMYLIRIIVIVASCYLVMSSKVKYKTY